jgi:hypothetical protein
MNEGCNQCQGNARFPYICHACGMVFDEQYFATTGQTAHLSGSSSKTDAEDLLSRIKEFMHFNFGVDL